MIKFVCTSCGERLSVPDAHGGKKGACPTCQTVNRIPLKGYAETQPKTPVVARAAASVREEPGAASEKPGARSQEPAARSQKPEARSQESHAAITAAPAPGDLALADSYSVLSPQSSVLTPSLPPSPAPESPAFSVQRSEFSVSPSRFTSPDKVLPPPDNEASLRTIRRAKQDAVRPASLTPALSSRPRKELRLPKQAKIALLILAALTFVAALYFALYLALHFAVPMS
jgi:hypothetical protein